MISEILEKKELVKADPVFGQLSFNDHEQVVFCQDKDTGLKAIIGIHNTVLGPALGGTRMWSYASEWEALNDVLRLSRGMTYKAAITGLNLGGGKAVIIGDAKTQKTPELMKRFGEFVHTLGGKYYTAEDVGMDTADMDLVKTVTPYVTGISQEIGGAGNPSPITAYGVYMGLKAAAKYQFGTDDLRGKKIVVQGIGHVGETLVGYLSKEDANVIIADINEERLQAVSKKFNFAGAANNQLADENRHGAMLQDKGIAYAPDFLINAGGIINVYTELETHDRDWIIKTTENIYNTTLDIFKHAEVNGFTSHQSALSIAEQRINNRKKENKN